MAQMTVGLNLSILNWGANKMTVNSPSPSRMTMTSRLIIGKRWTHSTMLARASQASSKVCLQLCPKIEKRASALPLSACRQKAPGGSRLAFIRKPFITDKLRWAPVKSLICTTQKVPTTSDTIGIQRTEKQPLKFPILSPPIARHDPQTPTRSCLSSPTSRKESEPNSG